MPKAFAICIIVAVFCACNEKKTTPSGNPKAISPLYAKKALAEKTKLNYMTNCGTCHNYSQRSVGPPIVEIQALYSGNSDGIVKWAQNPGKKRADYPRMPRQTLGEKELKAVAKYILSITE